MRLLKPQLAVVLRVIEPCHSTVTVSHAYSRTRGAKGEYRVKQADSRGSTGCIDAGRERREGREKERGREGGEWRRESASMVEKAIHRGKSKRRRAGAMQQADERRERAARLTRIEDLGLHIPTVSPVLSCSAICSTGPDARPSVRSRATPGQQHSTGRASGFAGPNRRASFAPRPASRAALRLSDHTLAGARFGGPGRMRGPCGRPQAGPALFKETRLPGRPSTLSRHERDGQGTGFSFITGVRPKAAPVLFKEMPRSPGTCEWIGGLARTARGPSRCYAGRLPGQLLSACLPT